MTTARKIEHALEREQRTMTRQKLLKQLWRLNGREQASDEQSGSDTRSLPKTKVVPLRRAS